MRLHRGIMALLTISIIFLCWFGLISCQRNHTLNLRILSSKIPELDGRDFDTYDLHPKQFKLPSFSTDYGSQRMNSNDELEDGIDADGWWEVKYSKHSVFDLLRKYKLYIRRSEIDINMIHSCYEYKVVIPLKDGEAFVDSSSFCYPSIIITGVPKCSTSAMFALLSSPPFISSNPIKENCLFLRGTSILGYFASLPKAISPGHYYIDGCIDVVGNMMLRKILRNPNTFYIVMVRNYADMIWSAYNYWCDPSVESNCWDDTKWAEKGYHIRSPELFHEILLSGIYNNQSSELIVPRRVKAPCALAKNLYRHYLNFLWSHTSRDSTLVVASEELERDPARIWNRLVKAIGLPDSPHPNFQSFSKVRYNTQGQSERGADTIIEMDSYTPGKYGISGNRPMLHETKQMLDQCWHDDCKELSSLAEFQYAACRDTPTVNTSVFQLDLSPSSIPPVVTTTGIIVRRELFIAGYLKRKLRKCYDLYGLHSRSLHNASVVSQQQQQQKYNLLRIDLSAVYRRNLIADNDFMYSNQILLLADGQAERDYIRGLLIFAYGADILFDGKGDIDRQSYTNDCSAMIISAPTNAIEFSHHNKRPWFKVKDSYVIDNKKYSNPCPNRVFSKIIYTRKDILADAWDEFIQTKLKRNSNSSSGIAMFDNTINQWNTWDRVAMEILMRSVYTKLSPTDFNSIGSNLLVIFPTHLITGSMKSEILRQLVTFINIDAFGNDVKVLSQKSVVVEINKPTLSQKRISCSFSLTKAMFLDLKLFFKDRRYLMNAYASKGLLCQIKQHYLKMNSIHMISFPRLFTCLPRYDNSSRIQLLSSAAAQTAVKFDKDATLIDVWKCDSWFFRRHFIEKITHHTTAFIASPGQDHINTRLLYEHATGFHTGAVESNSSLLSVFSGEFACGQRMGMIHVRSSSATITLTRGITPSVRLPLHGRRKCLKGMIRGFTRAVILAYDPFLAIWKSYLSSRKLTTSDITSTSIVDQNDWIKSAKEIARSFNHTMLELGPVYSDITGTFEPVNVFAITHAALIYVENEGRRTTQNARLLSESPDIAANKLSNSSSSQSRYLAAKQQLGTFGQKIEGEKLVTGRHRFLLDLAKFTGYSGQVTIERLTCAYTFINIGDELQELDMMFDHYRLGGGESLICEIKSILDKRLASPIKIRHIFDNVLC